MWAQTVSAASSSTVHIPKDASVSTPREPQGTTGNDKINKDTDPELELEQKINHLTTEIDKTLRWSEEYRQRTLTKVSGADLAAGESNKANDNDVKNKNKNYSNNDNDDNGRTDDINGGIKVQKGQDRGGLAHVFPHMHHL